MDKCSVCPFKSQTLSLHSPSFHAQGLFNPKTNMVNSLSDEVIEE